MKAKTALIAINILIASAIVMFGSSGTGSSVGAVDENVSINVYFCPEQNCSGQFINFIKENPEVKCAFYELSDEDVQNQAKMNKTQIFTNNDANKKRGIMHNKFCASTDGHVITGSYNPTQDNMNFNNILVIKSKTLSKNYYDEYDEIVKGNLKKTKITTITAGNLTINNYFCPEDSCEEKVISALSKAKHSIIFMSFTLTSEGIAEMLVKKKLEGINVEGLMEKTQASGQYSKYSFLKGSGIDVSLDNSKEFMHNKVFIIDNTTVITGSYNPTQSATTVNNENILQITNKRIAGEYVRYYNYLKPLLTSEDQNDGRSLSTNPTKESE